MFVLTGRRGCPRGGEACGAGRLLATCIGSKSVRDALPEAPRFWLQRPFAAPSTGGPLWRWAERSGLLPDRAQQPISRAAANIDVLFFEHLVDKPHLCHHLNKVSCQLADLLTPSRCL
jgi:hypothetical protein